MAETAPSIVFFGMAGAYGKIQNGDSSTQLSTSLIALTDGTSETRVCHEDVLDKTGLCGQTNSGAGVGSGGKSRRGESKS